MVSNKDHWRKPSNSKGGLRDAPQREKVLSATETGDRNSMAQRRKQGFFREFASETFASAEERWTSGRRFSAVAEIVDSPWRLQIDAVRTASRDIGNRISTDTKRIARGALNTGTRIAKDVAPFAIGGSAIIGIAVIGSLILVLKITKTGSSLIDKVV